MRLTTLALLASSFLLASSTIALHTGDVILTVQDGRIVTGAGDPAQGTYNEVRVFGSTLGAVFPNFASDPGFDSLPGTFQSGTAVGFNILDQLLVWNGSSFEPTGGEVMQISFLSATRVTGEGFVAGFAINVGASGAWHNHLNFLLQQGASPTIDNGVYLLRLELFSSAAIDSSRHFFVVFRRNASTTDFNAAAAYAEAYLLDPAIPGDINGDGIVNFTDLNILLGDFNTAGENLPGDIDNDGDVDFADLNVVLSNFNA